jgi:hypothetical protein
MPWKECSVVEVRLRFVARLLDSEAMTELCREFGKLASKSLTATRSMRPQGPQRPVRYANQLPGQVESLIVSLKRNKPHWGARKIRELLLRRLPGMCACPPKAPSMPSSTATASLNA